MTDPRDESTSEAPAELALLANRMDPPHDVRRRIVRQLRDGGLIAPPRARWRPLVAAAAIIAAFALGWILKPAANRPAVTSGTDKYVLLLYGVAADANEAGRVEEYRQWARGLAQAGRYVTGQKLATGSSAIGPAANDGDGGRLQGFFIIEAATEGEARDIAERHPHVRHGGTIVLRRIDPT